MTADIAVLTPAAIEQADPAAAAAMVTAALVESRSWLAVAMTGTDPTPIAEFKAWAATVEEATKQKKLGREIELDAAEMVRRAERGIGLAIRRGQAAGEIRGRGGDDYRSGLHVEKTGPREFFSGGQDTVDTYAVTDGVTDEQFDAAIVQAKAEGNLSRANVVRKVKGSAPVKSERPEILRKTHRIDGNRVIREAVSGAGLPPASIFDEVDFTTLDDSEIKVWVDSLTSHIAALRSLRTRLVKEIDRRV